MTGTKKVYAFASVPIFLSFLCMGFGDVAGTLVGIAKDEYGLNNFQSNWLLFAGFLGFGLLSVPMGIFQSRKGKKVTLLLGLIIGLIAVSLPYFFQLEHFSMLLISVLILGLGAATLQVSGNPIMRDVAPAGKYSSFLSLGQFVKAIGSVAGPLIPVFAFYSASFNWKVLFPIFFFVFLLTIILLSITKVRESETPQTASLKSCFKTLKNPYIFMMVLGIFLYVGAEQAVNGNIAEYMKVHFGWETEEAPLMIANFFAALTIGRLIGSIILQKVNPARFLIITVLISILGLAGLLVKDETFTWITIFVTGLGFANIFPLIFSITIDKMPEKTNEISGLMVTAIIGGAIAPILHGAVADASSVIIGFVVPLVCIIYILFLAVRTFRTA